MRKFLLIVLILLWAVSAFAAPPVPPCGSGNYLVSTNQEVAYFKSISLGGPTQHDPVLSVTKADGYRYDWRQANTYANPPVLTGYTGRFPWNDVTEVYQSCINFDGTVYQCFSKPPASISGVASTVIAYGSQALGTSAITKQTCATAVDVTATGVATTDVVDWGFNGDPTGVAGYTAAAGMLSIIAYPGTGHLYFKVCNNTSGDLTPGAITLNWRVRR